MANTEIQTMLVALKAAEKALVKVRSEVPHEMRPALSEEIEQVRHAIEVGEFALQRAA